MTQHKLGQCMREAGRPAEAADCFRRALAVEEAKLGPTDIQLAVTLYKLGQCVREAGKPVDAAEYFERALAIEEGKANPDDVQVREGIDRGLGLGGVVGAEDAHIPCNFARSAP